jgi:hypothetical protein
MKKTLAYLAAAILLGFVVARLPLAIKAGPEYLSPLSPPSTQFMNTPMEQDAAKDEISSALRFYWASGQPSSLLPSSLIFFSGLIVALTVYAVLKKRML